VTLVGWPPGGMETIGSTLGAVARTLAEVGLDEPRRRARRLIAAALDLSPSQVFTDLDRTVTAGDGDRVAAMLARAAAREPLSRILGVREFWGLEFSLSGDTLDPRPESETIVEAVLARIGDRGRVHRILDLGTGSGCLLLALLSELPASTGIGVDHAFGAVRTARGNAKRLGLAARAAFAVGDWAEALDARFDFVVANPPYIASRDIASLPPEVREFDPRGALDGGPDGLAAYGAFAGDLTRLFGPDGIFAGEIGQGQHEEVPAILAAGGLVIDAIVPDLAGIPRCVVARSRG
jgi:release factor glutamine methyltransferase